jgi:hypothetical protein
MTLLLNGCSYGEVWKDFPGVNLSKSGGSFIRSIRTTIEWIVRNKTKPNYVFIPITNVARFEKSYIMKQNIPVEGSYVNSTPEDYATYTSKISDSCYMDYDYAFMNIIMFSSWLEQQKIKYLIWDQCNMFDKKHIHGFNGMEKLKLVEQNNRIIPLFKFCGNQYMYEKKGKWIDVDSNHEPSVRHYHNESYDILKDYLHQYAKEQLNETIDWN